MYHLCIKIKHKTHKSKQTTHKWSPNLQSLHQNPTKNTQIEGGHWPVGAGGHRWSGAETARVFAARRQPPAAWPRKWPEEAACPWGWACALRMAGGGRLAAGMDLCRCACAYADGRRDGDGLCVGGAEATTPGGASRLGRRRGEAARGAPRMAASRLPLAGRGECLSGLETGKREEELI